jgi:hypothetical protein
MAQRQEARRYELERVVIVGDDRQAWAGMIAAFLICMALLSVAAIIGLSRHDLGGAILSGRVC